MTPDRDLPDCELWEQQLMDVLDARGALSDPALSQHPHACPHCLPTWRLYRKLYHKLESSREKIADEVPVDPDLTERITGQLQELVASTTVIQPSISPAGQREAPVPRAFWWVCAATAVAVWLVLLRPVGEIAHDTAEAPVIAQAPATDTTTGNVTASPSTGPASLQTLVATAGSAYQTLQNETVAAAREMALVFPQLPTTATVPLTQETPATGFELSVPTGLQPIQQSVREGLDFLWSTVPLDLKTAG